MNAAKLLQHIVLLWWLVSQNFNSTIFYSYSHACFLV